MKTRWHLAQTMMVPMLLMSFGLRIHQLGRNSFWNDEAGQILVATQPTLVQVLAGVRAHAMAMPLDYFVSRLVSQISLTEFVLRFPSVIWGVLAIALFFRLAQELTSQRVALVASSLLGLSVIHIQYAQELRFYSALSFFYIASTFMLFRAMRRPTRLNWVGYFGVTTLGLYFHPYILLTLINGWIYWGLTRRGSTFGPKPLLALIGSGLLLGLAFVPGYSYFGQQHFDHPFLEFNSSLLEVVWQGLGWLPIPYSNHSTSFGAWGAFSIGFAVIGAITVGASLCQNTGLISVVVGALVQIVVIGAADWFKGYWFLGRQIIHLAPMVMLLTATGIVAMEERLLAEGVLRSVKVRPACPAVALCSIIVFVLSVSSMPRLVNYYEWPKSNGRQVASRLLDTEAVEPILVIPGYEEKVYRYYWVHMDGGEKLLPLLRPTTWDELWQIASAIPLSAYLITPSIIPDAYQKRLQTSGFQILQAPEGDWYGTRTLWFRK